MIKVEIKQVLKPKEKVIVEFEFKCKTHKGSKTSKVSKKHKYRGR